MMTFSAIRGAQIIDVTKECTFEWYQEPKSCYAYLQVSSASGDFSDGETVTGGTSNATATVFSSYIDGGRVYVENVSGTFQTGETITGSSSNQTATVDGFVPERSWTSTPNNITHGTFPDSIFSEDLDDYLEWESSTSGAGFIGKMRVFIPKSGWFIITPIFGVGQRIAGSYHHTVDKYIYFRQVPPSSERVVIAVSGSGNQFEKKFSLYTSPLIYKNETQYLSFWLYHKNKYIFRWRIHNIRVLKLVI